MFFKLLFILTLINELPSAVSGPNDISNHKEADDSNFGTFLQVAVKSLVVLHFSSYAPGKAMDEHLKYIVIKHPNVVFLSVNINRCRGIATNYGVDSLTTFIVLMPQKNNIHLERTRHNSGLKNDYAFVDKALEEFETKIQRAVLDRDLDGRLILAKDKIVLLLFPVVVSNNEAYYTSKLETISKVFPMVVIIRANLTECYVNFNRYNASRVITVLNIISGGKETCIRGFVESEIKMKLKEVVSLQSEYSANTLPPNYRVAENDNDFRSILATALPTSVVILQFSSLKIASGNHIEHNDKYFVNNRPNILFISVQTANCRDIAIEYGIEENCTYVLLIPQTNKVHAVFTKRRDDSFDNGFAILQNDLDNLTARHQETSLDKHLDGRLILAREKIVLLVFPVNFSKNYYKSLFNGISDNYPMVVIIRADVFTCSKGFSIYGANYEKTTCIFIRNGLRQSSIQEDVKVTIENKLDELLSTK